VIQNPARFGLKFSGFYLSIFDFRNCLLPLFDGDAVPTRGNRNTNPRPPSRHPVIPNPTGRFQDKRALISGSSQGIVREIAHFAGPKAGADVTRFNYRSALDEAER